MRSSLRGRDRPLSAHPPLLPTGEQGNYSAPDICGILPRRERHLIRQTANAVSSDAAMSPPGRAFGSRAARRRGGLMATPEGLRVAVIIPAYLAAETIEKVLRGIPAGVD